MVESSKLVFYNCPEGQVSDFISGVMSSSFFLGEMVGPPMAGILSDIISFEESEAILAICVLVYLAAYFVFWKTQKVYKDPNLHSKFYENEMTETKVQLL